MSANRRMGRPLIAVIDAEPTMFHAGAALAAERSVFRRVFASGCHLLAGPRVEGGPQ